MYKCLTITLPSDSGKEIPISVFTANSLSKKIGSAAFTNNFTTDSDGAIYFASSNTAVATVNSTTGQVTIVANGTCQITASTLATYNYDAKSVSYDLKVFTYSIGDTIIPTSSTADYIAAVGRLIATTGWLTKIYPMALLSGKSVKLVQNSVSLSTTVVGVYSSQILTTTSVSNISVGLLVNTKTNFSLLTSLENVFTVNVDAIHTYLYVNSGVTSSSYNPGDVKLIAMEEI